MVDDKRIMHRWIDVSIAKMCCKLRILKKIVHFPLGVIEGVIAKICVPSQKIVSAIRSHFCQRLTKF